MTGGMPLKKNGMMELRGVEEKGVREISLSSKKNEATFEAITANQNLITGVFQVVKEGVKTNGVSTPHNYVFTN